MPKYRITLHKQIAMREHARRMHIHSIDFNSLKNENGDDKDVMGKSAVLHVNVTLNKDKADKDAAAQDYVTHQAAVLYSVQKYCFRSSGSFYLNFFHEPYTPAMGIINAKYCSDIWKTLNICI